MNKTYRYGLLALVTVALLGQSPAELKQRELSLVRFTAADLSKPVRVPTGYALVIGVSNYLNLSADDNLKYPESDAEKIYSVLISKEGGGFDFQNVVKLTGKEATLKEITNRLEVWLPSQAHADDRVVVFFAGHGVVDSNRRGYLAPYDVDPSRIAETAYPMDRLGQVLSKNIKARWKVLLTDACHSGKISVDSTLENVHSSLLGLPEGFLGLTSSRASEQSFEDPTLAGGNGVFSYFLARGWLGEADVDPADGVVTADELINYVKREVKAYGRERGKKQTPLEFGDFPDDLLLGFNPVRRQNLAKKQLETANGTVIFEVNLEGVEVYVDDMRIGTVSPGSPLSVPGLASGVHHARAVKLGYEPAIVEILVIPGGTQSVSLRLLHQRTVKPAAQALYDEGSTIWNRSRSTPDDLKKAASRFEGALKADPAFSAAALGLCRVQQAQDKTPEALISCHKAIGIDADYVEARAMYGVLLMENGDYGEAVRQLQNASIQDPKDPFIQSLFAEALFLADRPQEAEAAANRALGLDNTSAQAFLMRAEARRAQQRFSEADADYRQCLRAHEFGSGALRVAAYWAIGTGMRKHRSGRQTLYRSQAASAHFGLCACSIGQREYLQAIKQCNRVLTIDKDDPDAHLLLADSYARLFNDDNRRNYLVLARENLVAGLRINPNINGAAQLKGKIREIDEYLGILRH